MDNNKILQFNTETALDTSIEDLHQRSVQVVSNALPVLNDASRLASDIGRWGKQTKNGQLVSAAEFIRVALETAWAALRETHRMIETSGSIDAKQQATIAKYLHEIECLARELEILTEAIESGDTDNPRLQPIVDVSHEVGYEEAETELYEDVQKYICKITGIDSYDVTSRLISLIAGSLDAAQTQNYQPTPDEERAFIALVKIIERKFS